MDRAPDRAARCLLIAPLNSHAVVGRVAALAATGYETHLVDVAVNKRVRMTCYPFDQIAGVHDLDAPSVDPLYGHSRKRALIVDSLRGRGWLPENRTLRNRLGGIIDSVQPAVILTHYGPAGIHYARIVKRIRPGIPVICVLNLLPSTMERKSGVRKCLNRLVNGEFIDYRYWLKTMDGIVYASVEMEEFANRTYGPMRAQTMICPDYLPRSFQAGRRMSRSPESRSDGDPHVVFLGAPERWGATLDNIDNQFLQIAEAKIHVHSAVMDETVVATGYGHLYPRFTDDEVFTGELAEYVSQFDATLVIYNVRERHERFRSTYPTRFLTALTTGLPVLIRRGLFDACEKYVEAEGIGGAYDGVGELRELLLDRRWLADCRQRAEALTASMHAEAQGPELRQFIAKVLERGVSSPLPGRASRARTFDLRAG